MSAKFQILYLLVLLQFKKNTRNTMLNFIDSKIILYMVICSYGYGFKKRVSSSGCVFFWGYFGRYHKNSNYLLDHATKYMLM